MSCQTLLTRYPLVRLKTYGGKPLKPSSKRNLIEKAIDKYQISIRMACKLFKLSRRAYYYNPEEDDGDAISDLLAKLAYQYPRYGYWKLYHLAPLQGYIVNHKRVYKLYQRA